MLRSSFLAFVSLLLFVFATFATPPDEPNTRIQKTLAVQAAMVRARVLLTEGKSSKAVEVLEEQLANVNGSGEYLTVLRDAYRAYIRDLYFAGQPEQARRFLDRLSIIDPSAASDKSLQPQQDTTPRKFDPPAPKEVKGPPLPAFKAMPPPLASKDSAPPIVPAKPGIVRAQADDAPAEDPFAAKYQRDAFSPALMVAPGSSALKGQELLARGVDEFRKERYAEARVCFEQAYQADPSTLNVCKAQWAYCIIKGVSDTMEQPGVLPARLPELRQQVETAIGMAPGNMMAVGQQLLTRLDERAKAGAVPVSAIKVKHWGQNKEGWHVTESAHFRIFHRKDNAYAERVAHIAEHTRATMYRKWFQSDGIEWQPICELILHPTAADYTHMTGVPSNSPGHSRIESDPSGRVIARRMDLRLDITTMLEAVLPHETTHVVLAGMFGNALVPRWADEGIAVLSEPDDKIEQHRRNLVKHHKDGLLFGLKQLMELKDYPHPRQIGAFYAQSVVLVEFLTQKRGPKTLTDFVNDGIRHGYETALQRHYGVTFTQLEEEWRTHVLDRAQRTAASK